MGWPDPPAYVARRRVMVAEVRPGWPPALADRVLRPPLAQFIGRMAVVRCQAELVVWRAGAWHRASDALTLDVAQAPGGWRVVAWQGPAPAPAAFAWIPVLG
ncbi:MAG: hypothetical protein K6U87_06020 [Firmicutes bacterium]|nr:hypothetical protein [Bacillota bacterium]